jgi:hypothetical protein
MIINILYTLFFLPHLIMPIAAHSHFANIHGLAKHEISLQKRYADQYVNSIFKDNILLTLAYLTHTVKNASDINWTEIEKPQQYEFELQPGQTFAFHEDVLEQYNGKVALTTNAHFNFEEGYKSDGLVGDGVCHLASLFNWVATDAGLTVEAPTNHNFAIIPEISMEFGTSIYSYPGKGAENAAQNLYITNSLSKRVMFVFRYDGENLQLRIEQPIDL